MTEIWVVCIAYDGLCERAGWFKSKEAADQWIVAEHKRDREEWSEWEPWLGDNYYATSLELGRAQESEGLVMGRDTTIFSDGCFDIRRERQRQVESEGWSPDHDDGHVRGELAVVAAMLAVHGTDACVDAADVFGEGYGAESVFDPWGLIRKHSSELRRLEIAGALIAAEIDRKRREQAKLRAD